MRFDELLARAADEPEREVGYPIAPFGKTRILKYRHIFGPPASNEVVRAWRRQWPSHALPEDLVFLISRCNGIHLWADVETGRSYEGLAPIEEWDLARTKMYGRDADPDLLSDRYVALSYHTDGSSFAVLDVATGAYYLMDACGPDETCPIGSNITDLLAWLWEERIDPSEPGA